MKPAVLYRGIIVVVAVAALAVGTLIVRGARQPVGQDTDCVAKGSCLPSYRNTAICESMAVGSSETELVFRLGEPTRRIGDLLLLEPGATEPGPIEVQFDGQRNAVRLACHPRTPSR